MRFRKSKPESKGHLSHEFFLHAVEQNRTVTMICFKSPGHAEAGTGLHKFFHDVTYPGKRTGCASSVSTFYLSSLEP